MESTITEDRKVLYKTTGTCCQYIEVGLNHEGRVSECTFYGGCSGNTQGIARMVIGLTPEEIKSRLNGIRCGSKSTSCPDQLCRALEAISK